MPLSSITLNFPIIVVPGGHFELKFMNGDSRRQSPLDWEYRQTIPVAHTLNVLLLCVAGRRRPGSALLRHLHRHRADDDPGRPRADRPDGIPLLRRLLARLPRRSRVLATHHGEIKSTDTVV